MSRALVISGGGSKGAFAVGVLKKLINDFPNLGFDIFVGTSTGSLIIPLAATGDLRLLEELYTTQTTENIIHKFPIGDRLNEHSIFDARPLWEMIGKFCTDEHYQKLQHNGKKICVITTCLQSGEIVVYTNVPDPQPQKFYQLIELTSADHFRKAVMASACQPVFMPPVKVNAQVPGAAHPNFEYVDGGVREYAGVQMAIDQGATEIFTILLTPEVGKDENDEYTKLLPILQRTIDIFMTDVGKNDLIIPEQYNEALKYIQDVKTKMQQAGIPKEHVDGFFKVEKENPFENKIPLSIFIIRPASPLGGGPGGLTFNSEEMKNMVEIGQQVAGDFIASLDSSEVAWA